LPFGLVAQDTVSFADLFEFGAVALRNFFMEITLSVAIWVVLFGELDVSLLDLFSVSRRRDP
jgi:hypothetical protein